MKKNNILQPPQEDRKIVVFQQIRTVQDLSVSLIVLFFLCLTTSTAFAQQFGRERDRDSGGQVGSGGSLASLDPGPRVGFAVAGNPGNPIAGLTADQAAFFANGLSQFTQLETVAVTSPGNGGLGPAFNNDSCGGCHSQPATGGTSPNINAFPNVGNNPQFTAGQVSGGTNRIPFFVTADGPIREARFKSDGGVHDLFTIQGRTDVPNPPNNCTMTQPDFAAQAAIGNLSFRIPTPVFGGGLIENISEETLIANLAASTNPLLGIAGVFNRSGNDGSITRFGWKAQNKSLFMFAGEAYNVEMGITNEIFPNERGYPPHPIPPSCLLNPTPEDRTIYEATTAVGETSDIEAFAQFMRFLDQPAPACTGTGCSAAIQAGRATFTNIGCTNCHTPSMTTSINPTPTSAQPVTALSGIVANLFSDLALHHMGIGLADGISQGNAGPDQFRTSPLWGVGQRVFFLHDGRASNLPQAIQEHASFGSEANRVIQNYDQLSLTDKQNLILFLRSL
jgi:CxxC motif-containing protein (DUF1111 family)